MPALVSRAPLRVIRLAVFPVLFLPLVAAVSGCSEGSAATTAPRSATAPTFTTQPTDQTGFVGETGTFTLFGTGTAPLTYTWQRSATQLSTGSSDSYTTPVLAAADDGASYTVVVSTPRAA